MAVAYVAQNADHGVDGLVVIGCRSNGGPPLACDQGLRGIRLPVLDLWGDADKKDSAAAAARQDLVSADYRQFAIAGANHRFEGYESELVDAVVSWLQTLR